MARAVILRGPVHEATLLSLGLEGWTGFGCVDMRGMAVLVEKIV